MNKTNLPVLAVSFLAIATSRSSGQSGGGFDLYWSTIDSGGAIASVGGAFELSGTIGQPDAQAPPVMSGGSFELIGGFWPAASVCYCPADMNGDGSKDGRDVQMFMSCMIAGDDCSCADVDQSNGVNFADVEAFASELLAGPACP